MPLKDPLRRSWPALSLVLSLSLALSACGGDDTAHDDEPATGSDGTFPVSVVSGPMEGGEEITVEAEPTSIVSLSPTATEMLWAIGAEDQVVAVDDQSDYPVGVPTTELSGYEPNVEAILGYEPDLVVTSGDSGDLVSSLDKVGVPVLVLPSATKLEESYDQIERLGAATGHDEEAAEVVTEMQTGIEEAVAAAPDARGLTYFHELGPDLYTVTGNTFIGEVYGLFGMTSVADETGKGDDYPQLSTEYVVSSDPDLVLLADNECCGITPADVQKRPGWEQMSAVRNDRIHLVDEDITSRWGPRVVEFVELVGKLVAEHQAQLQPAA
ncbi:MAG: ABC transporter substrate-binding protein [Actinomycetota bacterium]|nr:ABC transporter substrate-binding protein [Actinomycetota bacterium]